MAFLMAVASLRFPTTNNQLISSSNLRNQATIQDGRVTVQQVQGRQGQNYSGTTYKSNATSSRGNTSSRQARVVKCYNCQGEGHMARQCTQPKRPRNAAWYKEKAMLAEAQEARQILDEEQLTFLADSGIPASQVQTVIPHNAAFQTEDLDTYDSDCVDLSNAQAVLMANISNYGSDIVSEVPNSETYLNDMDDQSANVQDTNLQAQQDSMILSVIEQMSEQMINHVNNWEKANKEPYNESITPELERYKERVKTFEQRLNIDLSSREKMHMLTKPQAFYDNTHKQALGFQNPFYLKKVQRIKPTLYDGVVISNTHVAMPVIDDEETLILEEESRSKMIEKAKDPETVKQNISHKPIDYFDSVVKKRTTPSALEEGEWGFEHTKAVFNNEIIPFLKSLKDIFNVFDKDLLNEITEVQTIFDQMEASVQQFLVDKKCLEIAKKEILLENDRLWQKIVSQDVMLTVMNSMSLNNDSVYMNLQKCELCEKCLNLDAELSKSKQAYSDLLKNHSQLEQHCISLEVSMQLKQEVFQNDKSYVSQNAVEIPEYFEINDLKARLQDKDKTICKLKDTIRSLSKNAKEENVNHDKCDLEPINEELENSVATLLSENERLCNEINHVKQVFKDQFDSIKQTRVRHKEQCDSLINKLNLKSVENKDLKAQIQDKVFVITSLKNDLRKIKGKEIVENASQIPSATTISPSMFKLDLVPLPPRLLQNREAHIDYIKNTQENANILREIVELAKAKQPLDSELDFAYNSKKIDVTPINNVKKVRFAEPITSSSKTQQVESSKTSDSNTLVLSSTGVKCSTSNYGSKPPGNKKNDRISQKPSKIFTIVGNSCPLTRITPTKVVPIKESTPHSVETQKPKLKFYRRPKHVKNVGLSEKAKILESKNANNSEPNHTWDPMLQIFHRRLPLGHNQFSVGQLCDSDLEVAFRKHTCFVRNLEGVDLLSGSRKPTFIHCQLGDMMASSPICLLFKASKTKSWLWHRRLSHLNFGAINHLAKNGLVRGLPKFKFEKDHMCSACAMGKSKKQIHKPKSEDTNQEKLYLLHMDLCGPMLLEVK
ncbi:retrovirus-related pol polyprotein from transposon TNT 1-94 [Tanacetum coccineum]